jgi:hypothetical protein
MKIVILALALLTSGCISSKYYYHISSQEHWRSYGTACAGPYGAYEKDLGDAARVFLMPNQDSKGTTLLLRYLVKKGSTVQLVNTKIEVQLSPSSKNIAFPIEEFKSGMEWNYLPKEARVKTIIYRATDKLKGMGRFSNNPQPSDRDDWYEVSFNISRKKLNWLKVNLPIVKADGTLIKVKPVEFEYKKGHYMMCVQ